MELSRSETLARLPQWLSLNYYHKGSDGRFTSEIINDDYFVAPNGSTNPHSELVAFQQAMVRQMEVGGQEDVLCRFPARMTFMQKSDPQFSDFIRPVCETYDSVNRPDKITSVSIVFASGHFDNPSSYYGHQMLKFNYGDDVLDQPTLDASLNYGANNTDNPGPLYIIRGVFGGYEAQYKRNNEFLNTHSYTNVQVRDVWEYTLDLTPEQRTFIVEHSWEVMRAKFSYYFFNDNCAHRIARLVENATGRDLTNVSGFWLLPTQVIRQMDNKGSTTLVKGETYVPSLKTVFSKRYAQLSGNQKEQLQAYLEAENDMRKASVLQIDAAVLFGLLDYYDLELAKLKEDQEKAEQMRDIHQQRSIILAEMLRRPASAMQREPLQPIEVQPLPDTRQPSSVRLESGVHDGNAFGRLTVRAANNDMLDAPITGQEVSKFIMGAAQLEYGDTDLSLRKVVALDIVNFNTNPLPILLTREYSWGFRMDYSPRNELCAECRSAGVEGTIGRAIRVDDEVLVYGLGGGRVHTKENDTGSYANLVVQVGSVMNVTRMMNVQLEGRYTQSIKSEDMSLQMETRHVLGKRVDLRATAVTNGDEHSLSAGLAWHFD